MYIYLYIYYKLQDFKSILTLITILDFYSEGLRRIPDVLFLQAGYILILLYTSCFRLVRCFRFRK